MEHITFKKLVWVDDFLEEENEAGKRADEILEELQGLLFENLIASQTLKQIHGTPKIFSLRIECHGIFFRFFGPKLNGCVYLLHAIKKKSNKIPRRELETVIVRTKKFLEML